MDGQESDMASSGFGNCITRDGQGVATANTPWGGFKITNLANGTASTDAAAFGQLSAVVGSLTGFIGGLTLSTAGSSATFGIAIGAATDGTVMSLMKLASAYTKTTASWALGTATGSLDAGSIAPSTWYHAFLIQRTDTGVVDVLTSLSATAPTLPTSYTLFRRIGSMKTDSSSHWILFTQIGSEFLWATGAATDVNSVPNTTQTLAAVNVPTGVIIKARISGWYQGVATIAAVLLVSSPSISGLTSTNTSGANVTAYVDGATGSGGLNQGFAVDVLTDTSARVQYVSNTANGSTLTRFGAYGWIDNRGSL